MFSLSVSNPRVSPISYRHTVCKKTHAVHHGNLALHMQYSNTCTNTQLRDSNQQSNIRSEDMLSSTHTRLRGSFTLVWVGGGGEFSKGQGILYVV